MGPSPASGWREAWETLRAILIAVVAALLIRQFVFETFQVQGYSMQPTLQNHERLLVNKFIYRFTQPQIGQIIVFHPPLPGATKDFVKRVVALGGQTFDMRDGFVYVNGRLQPEPYLPAAWRGDDTTPRPVLVPRGDVFVLGDHRVASEDSRYFGPVPISSIVGEVVLIWWPPADIRVISASG